MSGRKIAAALRSAYRKLKDTVETEEGDKERLHHAIIGAPGYDVFDPSEVILNSPPTSVKKGRRSDYAIQNALFVECKPWR